MLPFVPPVKKTSRKRKAGEDGDKDGEKGGEESDGTSQDLSQPTNPAKAANPSVKSSSKPPKKKRVAKKNLKNVSSVEQPENVPSSATENIPPHIEGSSTQFLNSLENLNSFLQSDDFHYEGLGNASSTFKSAESSMARLTSVFSNAVNVEDTELENVCKCLAYVGKSFSSEQPSDFRGISKDISPDFLASLLSLVLISKFLVFNFLSFSFIHA